MAELDPTGGMAEKIVPLLRIRIHLELLVYQIYNFRDSLLDADLANKARKPRHREHFARKARIDEDRINGTAFD